MKRTNNYLIMRDQAKTYFLNFDQQTLADRWNLQMDEQSLWTALPYRPQKRKCVLAKNRRGSRIWGGAFHLWSALLSEKPPAGQAGICPGKQSRRETGRCRCLHCRYVRQLRSSIRKKYGCVLPRLRSAARNTRTDWRHRLWIYRICGFKNAAEILWSRWRIPAAAYGAVSCKCAFVCTLWNCVLYYEFSDGSDCGWDEAMQTISLTPSK